MMQGMTHDMMYRLPQTPALVLKEQPEAVLRGVA
jgi:hypothetical protein